MKFNIKVTSSQLLILLLPLILESFVYIIFSLINAFFEVRLMCFSCMCFPKYDIYIPLPLNICLSGDIEYSIYTFGYISNAIFHILTYFGYIYFVIKSKYSPKTVQILNIFLIILNIAILLWIKTFYINI